MYSFVVHLGHILVRWTKIWSIGQAVWWTKLLSPIPNHCKATQVNNKRVPVHPLFQTIVRYVPTSGRSRYKSFRRVPPPPPTGPNSFVFTYVFTGKHLCRRLAPPPMRVGAPQREILDLPLPTDQNQAVSDQKKTKFDPMDQNEYVHGK